ncbi:bifunctional riboflavin kinase/FAD synthetase [Gracilibacillus kekensis]|uniref:Riboflavin biosynthesis protein n=1 Tax=Gracilibacillus kekensis TaxID=1027249 RepID=A0A1M7PHY9_9BACI|nr:bifunctional riboflavin kinase/FAD synthetase [Gracilibacillus kekensis]SHN16739.1 FMN adenylyltransferase /riboflavin kinase [Gracilibacillus kekensis]
MEVHSLVYPHQITKEKQQNTVAAIGFFDGVHLGHQAVIQQAIRIAKQSDRKAAVITFDPHPSVVLQNKQDTVRYITPIEEKIKHVESLGVDYLYIIRFDKKLAMLSPQAFIEHFIEEINITHIVAGFDFTFGHKGSGNMDNIHNLINDETEVTTVGRLDLNNKKISSTRIRKVLGQGEMEEAERLLGRPYSIAGEVIHGDKRGRTIGYPTANIKIEDYYFLPRIGVYAVQIMVGNDIYYGMANLGYNPTFSDDRENAKLEVNIFNFDANIYGENVVVYWKKYIRNEEKFSSVDELIDKIREDEVKSREFFSIND